MIVEKVKKRNGRLEDFDVNKINECVQRACEGIPDVSASEIVLDAQVQMHNKIPTAEIDQALILSAATKAAKEPNYALVASMLLFNTIYKEVFGEGVDSDVFDLQYRKSFVTNIKLLIRNELFAKELGEVFDFKALSDALRPERDRNFDYIGAKTISGRYLTKLDGKVKETPQAFLMRVAMGLALEEDNPTARAIEFYEIFSNQFALSSTPTLFNSGTVRSQLSSCFLSTFHDSIDGIFGNIHQQARLSKFAGGLGNDFTPLRGEGSYIKGTNGESTGIVPWIKSYDAMLVGVNQGGRRKGSGVAYLEPWHVDFLQFLDLRKATGDDRRRAHDTNTAVWMNDLFMKLSEDDGADWYMFCPSETPDLHEKYGSEFEEAYWGYVEKAKIGEIKNFRIVKAKELWKSILKSLFETGHPWITFKDACNLRSPQDHVGVVHSSNLCTEITLNTIPSLYERGTRTTLGETAVCNLASVNLTRHLVGGRLDFEKLKQTIKTTVRMLDNVIDLNFYPTDEAENSSIQHRPVGLGSMGWADVMMAYSLPYDSEEASELCDEIQEFISYHAILTSAELAEERGKYSTFEGSKWDRGILPQDSFESSQLERFGQKVKVKTRLDWKVVRDAIKQHGMRNSNVMAIAPNATIGKIARSNASIDPWFSSLYVKEDMAGRFVIVNTLMIDQLKSKGMWSPQLAEAIVRSNGDLTNMPIDDETKAVYKRAFQNDQVMLAKIAARRQRWIDQAQSFNIFFDVNVQGKSLKALDAIYRTGWREGLKTTYYLRTVSATDIEKTSDKQIKSDEPTIKIEVPISACRIDDPECESCQ